MASPRFLIPHLASGPLSPSCWPLQFSHLMSLDTRIRTCPTTIQSLGMQIGGGMPYPAIAIEDVGNSGGIDREPSLVPRSINIVPDPLSISSANWWQGPTKHPLCARHPQSRGTQPHGSFPPVLMCLRLSTIIRPVRRQ